MVEMAAALKKPTTTMTKAIINNIWATFTLVFALESI
jgi:hypothetical protein